MAPNVVTTAEPVANDVCFSTQMDSTFISNRNSASSALKWQYLGTPSGVMRYYPGVHFKASGGTCDEYDPRKRPWYAPGLFTRVSLAVQVQR